MPPKKGNTTNDTALAVSDYVKLGWVVIPLRDKIPLLKGWNIMDSTPKLYHVFNGKNIGVITGRRSGITVVDIDIKDDGLKHWKQLIKMYPDFTTVCCKTPSGGFHYYFQYEESLPTMSRFTLNGKVIGWDIMNQNRQVVLPPSTINNKNYQWINSPFNTRIIKMPKWLLWYLSNMKSFDK